MKVGDLVKTKTNGFVGIVVGHRNNLGTLGGKGAKWVRVFFTEELGKELGPVDGIFVVNSSNLEVVGESG